MKPKELCRRLDEDGVRLRPRSLTAEAPRKPTLAELIAAYQAATEEQVDPDTGEVAPPDPAQLEAIEADLHAKVSACGYVLKELQASAEQCGRLVRHYQRRADRFTAEAKRLRDHLHQCLVAAGKRKLGTPECTVSLRQSKAVELREPAAVPASFWREKVSRELNKRLCREVLDRGESVPGCELVRRESVVVR